MTVRAWSGRIFSEDVIPLVSTVFVGLGGRSDMELSVTQISRVKYVCIACDGDKSANGKTNGEVA